MINTVPNPFAEGELVDITIRGARVGDIYVDGDRQRRIEFYAGTDVVSVPVFAPGVAVTRQAPAEWPPQPGDVWADRKDDEWFAIGGPGRMIDHQGGGWSDANEVVQEFGPMRLLRRRGWTPDAPVEPTPESVEVDKRAAIVAGLHAMATFLAQNPNLPMPYGFGGQLNTATRDELRALVDEYGAAVAYDEDDHMAAKLWQGPVYLTFYCTESRPAPSVEPIDDTATEPEQRAEVDAEATAVAGPFVPYIGGGWINEATGEIVPQLPGDEPAEVQAL